MVALVLLIFSLELEFFLLDTPRSVARNKHTWLIRMMELYIYHSGFFACGLQYTHVLAAATTHKEQIEK